MIIGIHLGANYTRGAFITDGRPQMLREIDIPREGNADRLASVVSFHGNQIKIGTDGFKNQEREIVFDGCRVGTDYEKVGTSIWHAKRDPDGNYLLKKGAEDISQEAIVSIILTQIKAKFEKKHGPISSVVISVPYQCGSLYKVMIKNAAVKAGFDSQEIFLIEEIEAALLSFYKLSIFNSVKRHNLLVFKFGAGSFSISLVQKQSKNNRLEILKTTGNPQLGGEDITNLLMKYCLESFETDLANYEIRRKDLRESCERVKSDLSYFPDTKIIIEGEPLIDINRDVLNGICRNIIYEIQRHMQSIIEVMKARKIEIHDILLVGGSTRLHFIKDIIDSAVKSAQKSEYRYDAIVIPEEAIALGCAIHGPESPIEVVIVKEKPPPVEPPIPDPDLNPCIYHDCFIILVIIIYIVIAILALLSLIIYFSFFNHTS